MSQARIEIEVNEQHKHYWKRVRCGNCGYLEILAFPKKEKIENCDCPKCELTTLELI